MKPNSSKQDLSIAEQSPLIFNINPEKSKINLFIAESFKNLEIIEQTYQKSYGYREDVGTRDLGNDSLVETKRKTQKQKLDNYHRVTNSRKIKTKRTTKQHLPRSQYYYFHSMEQPRGQQQPSLIDKLLKDYEAFHSMIISNDFTPIENTVIRLSHYGNKKKKGQKSREKSLSGMVSHHHTKSFYHTGVTPNGKDKKPLSKSAVVSEVDMKRSVVLDNTHEQRLLQQARYKQTYQLNHSKKQPNPPKQGLSKYTTPIRTIYLNKSQQSPSYMHSQSSVNKLSVSTPLRNNKPYLNQEGKMGSVGRRERNYGDGSQGMSGMISLRKSIKKQVENSGKKSIGGNGVNNNSRPKLSVVSSQKKWSSPTQVQNVQLIKPNQAYTSKHQSYLNQLTQSSITLNKPTLIQTPASLLHSNRHSHSRSGSRKGLSLTQSASSIVAKGGKSELICPKSIEKINEKNSIQRQKDILARKLEHKGLMASKRVEIRIY